MSNLLEQASLVMIPSGYKEDIVYSEIPIDGSGDLTLTRASNGTRVNSAGLVEVCPWNFVEQSESIGTSPWLTNGATLTSGQTDPSGGTTAVKVQLASGGNNYVYQGIVLPNPINVVSAYLRADSATTIGFSIGGSTSNAVNLTTSWQLFTFSSADTSGGIIFDNYFGPSPTQQAKTFYIWHPQLNIGSTAKPYFPTTDRLNVPRLTYQNGGGGCPSLLLEKQSTNLAAYSQDISNTSGAYWGDGSSGGTATLTANYATSPDGTSNATRVQLNQGALYAVWQQVISTTGGQSYTYSIWMKAVSGTPTIVWIYDGTANQNITLTNEWVRYTWTFTAGSIMIGRFGVWDNVWGTSSSADFLAWGAQLEQSSYPTSYIPTTSSSATRVADLTSVPQGTIANFGTDPFSVFLDVNYAKLSVGGAIALLGNRQGGGWWRIYGDGSVINLEVNGSNGYTTLLIVNSAQLTSRTKIAISRNGNNMKVYVNGSSVQNVTNVVYSSDFTTANTTVELNAWGAGLYDVTTTEYNEVVLFKQSLTATELASLTTI